MTASRAILYCTVNGVCNNTNGLGRQTKTLLSALTRHGEELTRLIGPFDVHVACPQPGPDTWAFNPTDLAFSQQVVASWVGWCTHCAMRQEWSSGRWLPGRRCPKRVRAVPWSWHGTMTSYS